MNSNLYVGNLFSNLFAKLWGSQEYRILILGLDNAGKTTILYKLHTGEVMNTTPTIGFNMETLKWKNLTFRVWDLGGQTSLRAYWRLYYTATAAVIYVIDSTDKERLPLTQTELMQMLSEDELKDACLLVFANKQDLPNAMSQAEIIEALSLTSLKNRNWAVFATSALSGTGLFEGLDWLVNALKAKS